MERIDHLRLARPCCLALAFLLVVGPILYGCRPAGPDRVRVNGKITFAGGPPPANGIVFFAPKKSAEGFPCRPGRARFAQGDGVFSVTSVQPGDGLIPGTYRVGINCWRQLPGDDGTPGLSYIPASYTPPEITVTLDGPNPVEFNLDVPTTR
ncbi:MAG: hypothetical protein JW719_05370 [Pirellulales bacterium]|nr:hypothetical protein [Pirellulales bacterium]